MISEYDLGGLEDALERPNIPSESPSLAQEGISLVFDEVGRYSGPP
jgi:hypothetical protein